MKRSIFLILSLLILAPIFAHSPQIVKKVQTFGATAEIDTAIVYSTLQKNAPEDFQNPGIPSAAFVGHAGKFLVGIGGYAKAVVGFDFGHPIESPDEFITSQIPMTPMDGNGARFNLSAMQSHLFLNFVALPGTENEIGAFVSANFLNDYVPVLQFAYLKYRGLQAGYDYSLFSDPACGAPAVDYEGPSSGTANPVAGINYNIPFGKNQMWLFSVGIELPQYSFTTIEGMTKTVTQRVPDIPIALRYQWNEGGSWTRLSAIARTLTYREVPTKKNVNRFGYGFQLSGGWYFLDKFTLYYQGVWGKGIGSMIQDTCGEGLDLTPVDDGRQLDPVMLWGGFASLVYDINDRFCWSATYSQVRTYAPSFSTGAPGDTSEWSDMYKYAQYVSTNAFCHVSKVFDVGLEYIWGRRVNYSGLKCADNRIQAMFQLSF